MINLLGEHYSIVDVEAAEVVPVLMIAAAERARRRRRRITIVVVDHVIVGARDVRVGEHTAAEVDSRQVVVDGTQVSELDVRLGDTLAATGQVR